MDKGAWWATVLMIAKCQHDWVTKNELKMAVFWRHSHLVVSELSLLTSILSLSSLFPGDSVV